MSRIEAALRKAAKEPNTHPKDRAPVAFAKDVYEGLVNLDELVVTHHQPTSPASESFRKLCTRIGFLNGTTKPRTLLITSAARGEGKTTTALNLAAVTCQHSRTRTILVDFDLRQPSAHHLLGMKPEKGLVDCLNSNARLEDVVLASPIPGLALLPAGKAVQNPAEILRPSVVTEILNRLKDDFDLVILDSPPVLPVADTIVLAPLCDSVILVVQASKTSRLAVSKTLELLENSTVLGFVLNRAEYELPRYYRYDYYGKY